MRAPTRLDRRRRAVTAAGLALLLAALILIPAMADAFSVFVATRILVLGLFAVAYNVVFGYGGMPSLGHSAFFGIGGYAVGIGVTRLSWTLPALLVVAPALGALAGVVFGLFCLRVRGVYVLLLTLALSQALFGLAFYQTDFTGGDNGIPDIPREALPAVVREAGGYYLLTLATVAVCIALLWVFQHSPVGMAIVGMRESEARMSATGYRVDVLRLVAFAVSGAFSAIAGMLEVLLQGSVSTANLSWLVGAEAMVFAILGGARLFLGPFLGAAAVTVLEVWVSTYTERWTTVLGIIYVLTALFLPDGVLGRLAWATRRLGVRGRRSEAAAVDPAAPKAADDGAAGSTAGARR
jgi:branched-chain amino acid transport system permease protein